ncbi:MAG: hypothetical protein LBI96_06270 [Odoribacteraceae bacterium]|jgi:hypothetical protein|nr:hypothetical protein [Odoribacteraceae bacterium]
MLNRILFACCLVSFLAGTVNGQEIPESLKSSLELIGVTFTPCEQYKVDPWEGQGKWGKYACEDVTCPLNKFAVVDAEITSLDEQCVIYVYVSGANSVQHGKLIKDNPAAFGNTKPADLAFNRIKSNFNYGRQLSAATEQDIEDLKMLVQNQPRDSAKALFNADYMLAYPFNMAGQACRDRFTRTRVIVMGRGGLDIFLYFVMTDEGIKNFDQYLAETRGMFWFNNEEDN